MIPATCKLLAEVDFPIAAVSRHAAREKSIRNGHSSTLHLWWARRPLPSSRAMLMALLLPDTCDPHYPEEFKDSARRILEMYPMPADSTAGIDTNLGLHKTILAFIADFANWDLAANLTCLDVSRALVKATHGVPPDRTRHNIQFVVKCCRRRVCIDDGTRHDASFGAVSPLLVSAN